MYVLFDGEAYSRTSRTPEQFSRKYCQQKNKDTLMPQYMNYDSNTA